jgi:uncharacterized protein (TIGR02421 family)
MPVSESDLALDHKLSKICGLLPLLSLVTPVNVAEAQQRFFDGEEPGFAYRDLPDLSVIEGQLDDLSSEDADDPVIAHMAEGLLRELRLRLELLSSRDSNSFFLTSVELYGHVEDTTLGAARRILAAAPEPAPEAEKVGAVALADHARHELDIYRREYPELAASVQISSTTSGVMVEAGNLYISSDIRVSGQRVYPLLQHEVGTHIVTYENGRAQPLHMLSLGLAHYDELQEALGVLAEYLCGGLPPSRLRVLAYRVIAAHLRGENATFRETYGQLTELGCSRMVAFTTVMRAYRSGGMTKDAIYLRGLMRLLALIEDMDEVDLTPMLVGKVSFESLPLVRELLDRSILSSPPLVPRYLMLPEARKRMRKVQNGLDVLEVGGIAA